MNENAATILLVDDDLLILRSVSFLLQQEGYQVVPATSGAEALAAAAAAPPDIVLLDLALPDLGGVEVCRRLRRATSIPIVIMSARHSEADKIVGLDAGADDYLTKPIGGGELAARVRAALRRSHARSGSRLLPDRLVVGEVMVDNAAHRVYVRGEEVALSPREFALLQVLVAHAGRTVERRVILECVWGRGFCGDQGVLTVFVRQLRRKIERDPNRPVLVETERGVGYRLAPPAAC